MKLHNHNYTFILIILLVFIMSKIEMKWIDSIVYYKMNSNNVSIDKIFSLYVDLPKHPMWSLWLKQVDYNISSGISSWTISKYGLTYHWNANNTLLIAPHIIQWESINGFPNRGKVEFIPIDNNQCMNKTSIERLSSDKLIIENSNMYQSTAINNNTMTTIIKMTISYDLPHIAAIVLNSIGSFATEYIEHTIVKDLERFEKILLHQHEVI